MFGTHPCGRLIRTASARLISLALKAIFVENILLAFFLGMCSYLAVSKRVDTAIGLGLAVIFVLTITAPVNWFIYNYILRRARPGLGRLGGTRPELPRPDLLHRGDRRDGADRRDGDRQDERQALLRRLGIFLPLIAVNCAILGASLFMQERDYTLPQSTLCSVWARGSAGPGDHQHGGDPAEAAHRARARRRCAASASPSS